MTHHSYAPSRRTKLSAGVFALAIGTGITLTACTASASESAFEKTSAANLVPESAQAYTAIALKPSKQQQTELYKLSNKLPTEVRAENGDQVRTKMIDSMLKDTGLTYDADLKPWIGDEIAGAVLKPYDGSRSPLPVALIETKDEAKTRETLKKKNVDERTFKFIGDYVVMVNKEDVEKHQADKAFAEIEDVKGGKPSLKKNARFKTVLDKLHNHQLGIGWIDIVGLLDTTKAEEEISKLTSGASGASGSTESTPFASGQTPSIHGVANTQSNADADLKKSIQQLRDTGSIGFEAFVTENSGVLQSVTEKIPAGTDKVSESKWIESLPSDTLGAFSVPDVTEIRDQLINEAAMAEINNQLPGVKAFLSTMSGEGLVAIGNLPKGGTADYGLATGVTDAQQSRNDLKALVEKLRAQIGTGEEAPIVIMETNVGDTTGYSVRMDGKERLVVAVSNDRIIAASNVAYAQSLMTKAQNPLSSNVAYGQALVGNTKRKNGGIFFVDLQKVIAVAKDEGGNIGAFADQVGKSFGMPSLTPSTTTTISKTAEEWQNHLQSAGAQGWYENGHAYSEMRITLK